MEDNHDSTIKNEDTSIEFTENMTLDTMEYNEETTMDPSNKSLEDIIDLSDSLQGKRKIRLSDLKKFIKNVNRAYKSAAKIRAKREEDKKSSLVIPWKGGSEILIGEKEINVIDNMVLDYLTKGINNIFFERKNHPSRKFTQCPVYIGGTPLFDFITKGNFGAQYVLDEDTKIFSKTNDSLIDALPLLKQGYILSSAIKDIFAIYRNVNKIASNKYLCFDEHMNNCFNSSTPSMFIKESNEKKDKILMINAVKDPSFGLEKPLNTVEAINYGKKAGEKKFDPENFVHFAFSTIETLNSFSLKLLGECYKELDNHFKSKQFKQAYETMEELCDDEDYTKLTEESEIIKVTHQLYTITKKIDKVNTIEEASMISEL